eukprot:2862979-Pyramimonas_sp.AAC.1
MRWLPLRGRRPFARCHRPEGFHTGLKQSLRRARRGPRCRRAPRARRPRHQPRGAAQAPLRPRCRAQRVDDVLLHLSEVGQRSADACGKGAHF